MEGSPSHLTVVVGGSRLADELRRCLVQRGVDHVGIATHLRGLRSSMATGDYDCMIVCIALDAATLQRHGEGLRQLLQDRAFERRIGHGPRAGAGEIRSIGVLTDIGLTAEVATLGCDVFVADTGEAVDIAAWLADEAMAIAQNRSAVADQTFAWRFGASEAMPEVGGSRADREVRAAENPDSWIDPAAAGETEEAE